MLLTIQIIQQLKKIRILLKQKVDAKINKIRIIQKRKLSNETEAKFSFVGKETNNLTLSL